MPSKKGGYKIVSLGGLDLTGENLSLKGLYNALKLSYGKVILLSGIVINSVAKKDAYVQAEEGDEVINIKHVYGYNLSVDDKDAITVEVDSEGIELPVPTPEDDGMLVGVNVQGKYVLKPAPSGGTKLYKHSIADNSHSLGIFITIISTISTPITDSTSLSSVLGGKIGGDYEVVKGDGTNFNVSFYSGMDDKLKNIQYPVSDMSNPTVTLKAFNECTDTVTEL